MTPTKTPKMISFVTGSTAYYPDPSPLEGGYEDRMGKPLCTLQDHLNGEAPYVSVAMDLDAWKYGTRLCIPELEEYYGRPIEFRVVDTGGAFNKPGVRWLGGMDICVKTERDSFHTIVNQSLYVVAMVAA